jgi:hypothetical protein
MAGHDNLCDTAQDLGIPRLLASSLSSTVLPGEKVTPNPEGHLKVLQILDTEINFMPCLFEKTSNLEYGRGGSK